jgi:hypothetical protein
VQEACRSLSGWRLPPATTLKPHSDIRAETAHHREERRERHWPRSALRSRFACCDAYRILQVHPDPHQPSTTC